MAIKRASMKGAKGLLDNIPKKEKTSSRSTKQSSEIKWRKVTVRFEENFFLQLKEKLRSEGRTLQGYIDYLIRRDLESGY